MQGHCNAVEPESPHLAKRAAVRRLFSELMPCYPVRPLSVARAGDQERSCQRKKTVALERRPLDPNKARNTKTVTGFPAG